MAKRDDAPDEVLRNGRFTRQEQPIQQEPIQPVQPVQQIAQQQAAPTVVQNPMPTPETPPMQGNYSAYAKYSTQLSGMNRANELRQQAAQQGLTALQNANANTMKGYEERLNALRRAQENTQAAYNERLRLADEEANIRKQANEAARQAALQQALGNYGLQKDTLAQQADDAARQAYISRMIAERDLGQQLAAAGYTGGMAESSRLGLLTNYENNRNSILRDRDNNLAAIDLAMRNAEAQTAADIANQNAGFDLQNLTTRGNLYTGMLEAMSQGDTNRAGLYAQMLNAQSQGDTNLANYLSDMANQEAENEIALANLYAQMTGTAGGGSGGGTGSGSGRTGIRSSKKNSDSSDEEVALQGNPLASAASSPLNSSALQGTPAGAVTGLGMGNALNLAINMGMNALRNGNTGNAAASQASPATSSTGSTGKITSRSEALRMVRANGGGMTDMVNYITALNRDGRISDEMANWLATQVTNGNG